MNPLPKETSSRGARATAYLSTPCFVSRILLSFFGPQVGCSRFSVTIRRSTSVRFATHFGARLRSAKPLVPSARYLASHLWPVFREIPKLAHNSFTSNYPLSARLANRILCSIGDSVSQGI